MNSKSITAVSLAILMALASVTVIGPGVGDSDAVNPNESGTNSVTVTLGSQDAAGTDVFIWFSETQYNLSTLSGYKVAWSAVASAENIFDSAGSQGYTSLTSRAVTNNDGTFTAEDFTAVTGTAVGNLLNLSFDVRGTDQKAQNEYLLNIKNVEGNESDVYLILRAEVTLADNNLDLDPVYYRILVDVTDQAMTFEGTYSFTTNNPVSTAVEAKIGGSEITETNYTWYAVGLPRGLSMSPDGTITGLPLQATTGQVDVAITAVNTSSGQLYYGTLKVSVTDPAEPTVGINVTSTGHYKPDSTHTYYVEKGDNFTFNVSVSTGVSMGQVVMVDSNDRPAPVNPDNDGVYTANTDGTGSYYIRAYATAGSSVIYDQIQIIVVASGEGEMVQASITASSESAQPGS